MRITGRIILPLLVFGLFVIGSLYAAPPKGIDKPAVAPEPQKILMIGNSLTYTWGIPSILEHFATASNRVLAVTAHIAGGKDLTWHWNTPAKPSDLTAKEAIEKGGFDLVIVQEYSNNLQRKEGQDAFNKIAPEYIKAIRAASMKPMFYMAHPTAKEVNADALKGVIESNSKMADALSVPCAPVALAFIRCNEKYPQFALIDNQADRKYAMNKVMTHQSPFGSYLAACTLYAAIYHQTPVGLSFHAAFDGKTEVPIEAADAAIAQEIAWSVWQEYDAKHPVEKPSKAKGR